MSVTVKSVAYISVPVHDKGNDDNMIVPKVETVLHCSSLHRSLMAHGAKIVHGLTYM